jgi:hypothetical protein
VSAALLKRMHEAQAAYFAAREACDEAANELREAKRALREQGGACWVLRLEDGDYVYTDEEDGYSADKALERNGYFLTVQRQGGATRFTSEQVDSALQLVRERIERDWKENPRIVRAVRLKKKGADQ